MRNFVQAGKTVTVTAPAGGILSGDGVLVGYLFGVAATSASAGQDTEIATEGVFNLPLAATSSLSVGDRAYWDPAAKAVTATAGTLRRIGVAVAATGTGSPSARIRLDGLAV